MLVTAKADNHTTALPNRVEESKTRQEEEKEQEAPEVFVQERQIKCTPFRFPTGEVDDDSEEEQAAVPENEDVPMIEVEKLDRSPERKNEMELDQQHKDEDDDEDVLSEEGSGSLDEEPEAEASESYEEEMEEDGHGYGESDSW